MQDLQLVHVSRPHRPANAKTLLLVGLRDLARGLAETGSERAFLGRELTMWKCTCGSGSEVSWVPLPGGGLGSSYVINHLVRDGAVVLEEIEVRGLGGSGQFLDHGLLKEELSACRP